MSDVSKWADPSTVGLAAYALGLFCLAALVSGVAGPAALAVLIPMTFGVGLLCYLTGIIGFIKGELFTAVAFNSYGLFWCTFALLQLGVIFKWWAPDNAIMLYFYGAYTIFTAILFIATLVTNTNVILVIGSLLGIFVLLDLSIIMNNAELGKFAGYLGFASALIAFYFVAASVLNAMYGRTVLSMGSSWSKPNC